MRSGLLFTCPCCGKQCYLLPGAARALLAGGLVQEIIGEPVRNGEKVVLWGQEPSQGQPEQPATKEDAMR